MQSDNNLININFNSGNNTKIKKSQNRIRKKEFNKEDYLKKNYLIISDIKRCKLFSNINKAVINNKNKKIISNNYNGQKQNKVNDNITNPKTKKEVSNQNGQLKISDYKFLF